MSMQCTAQIVSFHEFLHGQFQDLRRGCSITEAPPTKRADEALADAAGMIWDESHEAANSKPTVGDYIINIYNQYRWDMMGLELSAHRQIRQQYIDMLGTLVTFGYFWLVCGFISHVAWDPE